MGNFLLRLFLFAFATTLAPCAEGQNLPFLDQVKLDYRTLFVSKINSASTIRAPGGTVCFYKYDSEITDSIRGEKIGPKFPFYSESKLTVGTDYLIFFSAIDATKYRIFHGYAGPELDPGCRKFMDGYLLLYNEVSSVRAMWDGHAYRSYIEFGDPAGDAIQDHAMSKSVHLVDFDYVEKELKK